MSTVISPVIDELRRSFAGETFEAFLHGFRRRVQHLSVCMVDGQVIARAEAERLTGGVVDLVRDHVLGALADRPGDALRILDVLRGVGTPALEHLRAACEATQARLHPPPPPVRWPEILELRALAERHPEHCEIGPPVTHIEFAARLAALGTALPIELLALYAACGHITLTCRHVATLAGMIGRGESLRAYDGRIALFKRVRRDPRMLFVEQPGISIWHELGSWWLVLEDEQAPATKRPLDLQSLLRFALRRMEAPSREVLLTDLAWKRFFI
ncbi:MAG TPA: hypothetical protein VFP84_27630 [Kofleriaceae bacterium]|nr:hypothetical protein [Kofleriaceae bacterium]